MLPMGRHRWLCSGWGIRCIWRKSRVKICSKGAYILAQHFINTESYSIVRLRSLRSIARFASLRFASLRFASLPIHSRMDVRLKCRSCSFKGRNYEGPISKWGQHNKNFHSNDTQKCQKCPMIFDNYLNRNLHQKEDHVMVLCLECHRLGQKPDHYLDSKLDSHYREQHKHLKLKCPNCRNRFHANTQLVEHRRSWHHFNPDPPAIPCENCRESLKTKKDMISHNLKKHPNKPYTCGNCENCFGSRGGRDSHRRGCKTKYK